LNAKEFTEVTERNWSVRTKPEIAVVMSGSLTTAFPDNKHIIIIIIIIIITIIIIIIIIGVSK